MSPLSFSGHTVVITGAGGGLGKAYSLAYAARGANVVVNDFNKDAAQAVVDEITKAGGKAVVNNSSVTDGEAVIKTALDAFGGVTILINNAGILRDKGFKNMSDAEFDAVQAVHLKGAFSCTKAVWPLFRKQKFGRVVNTASAAGLYGNFGQANYSAAKSGLIAYTKTLAREGAKYGVSAICIAPMAASKMTETIMPPEMLANLKPSFVSPFVLAVTHPDGPQASGKVFEVGAGYVAEIRWERSKGAVFKTDASFTPSAVKEKWSEITDFTNPDYIVDFAKEFDAVGTLKKAMSLPTNPQASPEVRFDGKTVIITGAGAGLGRAYALMYAKLGANVVINDVSEKGASAVVEEITKTGGKATAVACSAEDGETIVKAALEKFGGVHILVANAGILRDKSFAAMTEQEWDAVMAVHLRGTYKCCKAVWPIFQKQKYGRIVTTCSQVGIYGNFGQANYSTAKAAILGLSRTLAIEGRKYGILVNIIAPSAGTAMTSTIWPPEMVDAFKPDYIAPIVGYLSSEANEETTGSLFEIMGGWAAQTRWQRAGGHGFPVNKELTPEDVVAKWGIITNFNDGRATYPTSTQEAIQQIVDNFSNTAEGDSGSSEDIPYADPEDSELVLKAKKEVTEKVDYTYTERDVILYNLGVGATEQELHWTYEGDENFSALPTFGVIPQFLASGSLSMDWLPNWNPAKLVHGEQYLQIRGPIPTSGELVSEARILEVLDKGKAAAVTSIIETKDKKTGAVLFDNTSTVFVRGCGGFGGKRNGKDRGPATAPNVPPKRAPDATLEEKTLPTQAALYRLSGDLNPLHMVPEFAAIGGFDKPVLHGLCTMGISGKHVLKSFGQFKDIKVRFAGVVFPGETLVTEMWKEGDKVIFVTKVKERGTTVLSAAAATLAEGSTKAKL
ncbi:multifunctional beta-oxidation protein [Punctularia strigosozonata HHB-11173 SS5]|uniref:Multifunctional beta-oxidation protein n=1 Tax=Punctularia strigosozonata (strain HHB-11173) TaxID=741275 RepID=R7S0L4_PUNST|nr:multifunctional beta-oxidation protein [Punctularia strigosozonata HHB-11173 SS5]EIN03743.1 multifunctional beta-oxidation protein [Punctularia strigosozonata HHB-11173 SS5]